MNTFMTNETNELIKQAFEHSERHFFINKKVEADLFSKLNLINEQTAIPVLLPLIFSHNKRLAKTVAETIHKILIKIPTDKLQALDEMIRRTGFYSQTCNQIKIDLLKYINLEKPVFNSICYILCSHYNGYVREQAIEELLPECSKLNIPILLIRVNDWVDKIKLVASMKLIEIIDDNKIIDFLPSLNFIAQLYKKERYNHSELISKIENKLIENCYNELLQIVTSSDKNSSRIAFKIAARSSEQTSQLIHVSSQSRDLVIKLWTLDLARQHLHGDMLFEFLGKWIIDKSPIIRRKCVYILLEEFPEKTNSILTNLLFDKSRSLRELAIFYLKRNGINDIKKYYKEALFNKDKPAYITIIGLAEVGDQDDFKLVEPYMNDPSLNIRSACIYAVFKLEPTNKNDIILQQLPSNEPKILKAVCFGLMKNSDGYDINAIEKIFYQKGDLYLEQLFIKMKLAVIQDRWQLVDYLLENLHKVKNDKLKLFLEHKIERWIIANSPNNVFTRPNKDILISIIAKTHELISEKKNVDLFNKLHKNLICFLEK